MSSMFVGTFPKFIIPGPVHHCHTGTTRPRWSTLNPTTWSLAPFSFSTDARQSYPSQFPPPRDERNRSRPAPGPRRDFLELFSDHREDTAADSAVNGRFDKVPWPVRPGERDDPSQGKPPLHENSLSSFAAEGSLGTVVICFPASVVFLQSSSTSLISLLPFL